MTTYTHIRTDYKTGLRLLLGIFLLFSWRTAFAQVSFSEIMYNPKGADTGHEWVEVVNEGSSAVDLSQSKFLEVGATTENHGIVSAQGPSLLAPGAYAIVADNAQIFLSDHPGFTGSVVDSSFSLSNTGQTISFKMPDGSISDTATYTKDMGAYEDENSLQKIGGAWKGAAPTPGAISSGSSNTSVTPEPASATTATSPATSLATFPVEPQIFTDAGPQAVTVSVGAPVIFTGRVWGLKKEPIENARMTWALGDGGNAEGASVSHVYYYPGEYTAILDAASGYYSASDRVRVLAVAPSLALHTGGDNTRSYIAIENFGGDELDLSSWKVTVDEKTFALPKNTVIGGHKILTLPSEVSGIMVATSTIAKLYFPNGTAVLIQGAPAVSSPDSPLHVNPQVATMAVALRGRTERAPAQAANVLASIGGDSNTLASEAQESSLWMWYTGIALLGALAVFGLRMGRKAEETTGPTAEDFEIIEESDD